MAPEKDVQPTPAGKVPARVGREPASPSNCVGELVQLPDTEGVTHSRYQCQVCDQIVHVGHEEREANGLPPEHHRLTR